jgi:hypothetical protein
MGDKNFWPDARYNFWGISICSIYRLVQNIFPGDMDLQMQIYQEFSKK